ncbi:N-acetyl-gamma-glutamyl-phosphate reductase [Lysobacter sp. Root494]|nr:N-acetyl-gamma-glutamyl-phosphate reductase [Lysobacter sp. Root494]
MKRENSDVARSVGIIGARGYVGSELIRLIAAHPELELAFVSSRERAGQKLADHEAGYRGDLAYVAYGPEEAAGRGVDALVLALPNGKAAPFVAALDSIAPDTLVVDLSADYRFDDGWYYGLPELTRAKYAGQRRISNPGCYATAMQLAVAPMLGEIEGPVQCFGVSGYSGAGTTPSDKNDPEKLRDNLMPYSLANHVHEREVGHQLGHAIEFMPHVAPHFRGLTITSNLHLRNALTREEVVERYRQRYAGEPLVRVVDEAPWVSHIANAHHVDVGGFTLSADGTRLVVVSTEDNLLKGAATQALQNLNLAFGFPETTGIPV